MNQCYNLTYFKILQGFNEVVPVYENATQFDRSIDYKRDAYNERGERRKLIRLEGLLGELIDKIRKNLQFDMEFVPVHGFGVKMDNGSFNGVLGMVQRRVSKWDTYIIMNSGNIFRNINIFLRGQRRGTLQIGSIGSKKCDIPERGLYYFIFFFFFYVLPVASVGFFAGTL